MKQFICKVVGGKLTPLATQQDASWNEFLQRCERSGVQIKVTLEAHQSNIVSFGQQRLYRAFIIQLGKNFGLSFIETEKLFMQFMPIDAMTGHIKVPSKWSTAELNDFIEQVKAHVATIDPKFDF